MSNIQGMVNLEFMIVNITILVSVEQFERLFDLMALLVGDFLSHIGVFSRTGLKMGS